MQRFHIWFRANLSGKKGQRGFTLIELLVVVTILGILAGIVTLSLVGLTTHSSVQACNSEYKTVQAALDAYMANNNLSTLPAAQGVYTNDMTVVSQLHAQRPDAVLLRVGPVRQDHQHRRCRERHRLRQERLVDQRMRAEITDRVA